MKEYIENYKYNARTNGISAVGARKCGSTGADEGVVCTHGLIRLLFG